MKDIKLISIQGKYAPYFYLQNEDSEYFRAQIDTEAKRESLIISSAYRTDILYYCHEDISEVIIEKWCAYMGYHFDSHVYSKFICSTNEQETFELYYDTLLHMILHTNHYSIYKKAFDEIKRGEAKHSLLKELLASKFKLSKSYVGAYAGSSNDDHNPFPSENFREVKSYHGFTSLALQGIKNIHSN